MPARRRTISLSSTGIITSASPSHRGGWRITLSACLALAGLPAHVMASVEVQPQACSPLLMAAECDQYLQRLRQAPNEARRREVTLEYESIVNERRRACPLFLVMPAKPLALGTARPGE